MSDPERQSLPEFHPAHWAILTDQRHRMMDVRSMLDCARYVLLNNSEIDVEGAVSIAHDVLDDVINQLDCALIDVATEKWLADREREKNV